MASFLIAQMNHIEFTMSNQIPTEINSPNNPKKHLWEFKHTKLQGKSGKYVETELKQMHGVTRYVSVVCWAKSTSQLSLTSKCSGKLPG